MNFMAWHCIKRRYKNNQLHREIPICGREGLSILEMESFVNRSAEAHERQKS